MAIRDRECTTEGCSIPAAWCEAHHWQTVLGPRRPTDLADGKLLCSFHHHRAHDPAWQVHHHPTVPRPFTGGREDSAGPAPELPLVHLDPDVPIIGEDLARAVGMRSLQQDGRAQHDKIVVGQQRTTGDQSSPSGGATASVVGSVNPRTR